MIVSLLWFHIFNVHLLILSILAHLLGMCVEWEKMKAHADCWHKEILLTMEEM